MGLFSGIFGKPKVDHATARHIGQQAMSVISNTLSGEEQNNLVKHVDDFYSKTKMWTGGKSGRDLLNYYVVLAKYLQFYINDSFKGKLSNDASIKLSQAAITFELTTTLNSQKQNPHSEVAQAFANAIINQEYALQSSYILATESPEFLEFERYKVNKVID